MGVKVIFGAAIRAGVEQVLDTAKEHVLLVSPYTRTKDGAGRSDHIARSILGALGRKVRVRMVVRPQEDGSAGREDLHALVRAGLELYELESLHAKLYLSDQAAIVTSLNLYAPTGDSTLDLGVTMTRDEPGYRDLVHFVDSKVVPFWTKAGTTGAKAWSRKTSKEEPRRRRTEEGNCIRCGDSVRLNPERPLCPDCYDTWVCYENPDYEENFCHACGDESETSMRRPLCKSCYSRR